MHKHESQRLFERAERVIPGGVNSPVRAFRAVGGSPPFVARAAGARIYDADGNEYIDYVGSWGPAILGHAHPEVIAAVRDAANRGLSFGAPTEQEIRIAELIVDRYPSIQMLRCVSSGTEATMSAIRVARGYTGRQFIVKFEGGYHGHSDGMLAKAGSGVGTLGIPDSAGVPDGVVQYTLTLPYNDVAALCGLFQQRGPEIAAVIVEPVAGNMGCVPPSRDFLESIVSVCKEFGSVSIFDEVMTGCRVSRGGAQAHYWRHSGHDLPRQSRGRRYAFGGLRWAARNNELCGPTWARVPSWHVERQPDCRGRGYCHPRIAGFGRLRETWRRWARPWNLGSRICLGATGLPESFSG